MPGRQVRPQAFPLAAQELISLAARKSLSRAATGAERACVGAQGPAAQAASPGARAADRGGAGDPTD